MTRLPLTHNNFTVVPQWPSTSDETKCSPTAILCNNGDERAKTKETLERSNFSIVLRTTTNRIDRFFLIRFGEAFHLPLVIFFPSNMNV